MGVTDLRATAHVLKDVEADYRPLLDMIGDAPFVLLGEP